MRIKTWENRVFRTLLQARWRAVFLLASCSVRSAFALLTNTSAKHRQTSWHIKKQTQTQLTTKTKNIWGLSVEVLPTALVWPFSAAIMSGVCLQHPHSSPVRYDPARAADTPHDLWMPQHEEESCHREKKLQNGPQPQKVRVKKNKVTLF